MSKKQNLAQILNRQNKRGKKKKLGSPTSKTALFVRVTKAKSYRRIK